MIDLPSGSAYLGWVWIPSVDGPSVMVVRNEAFFDITARAAPTVWDVIELADPLAYSRAAPGDALGPLSDLAPAPAEDLSRPHLLASCNL